MWSNELSKIATKMFGKRFAGVYPLDVLPDHLVSNSGLVVNTQSHNLPGEHWIAVFKHNDSITAYDPLGIYYPAPLVSWLHKQSINVRYNYKHDQPFNSNLCGEYCFF